VADREDRASQLFGVGRTPNDAPGPADEQKDKENEASDGPPSEDAAKTPEQVGPIDSHHSNADSSENDDIEETDFEESPADDTSTTIPGEPGTGSRTPFSESLAKVQIRVVGCGQCGSQIAGTFLQDKPEYVPTKRSDYYPIKSVAFDTDDAITQILPREWDWQLRENIFVLPMPSAQYLTDRINQGKDFSTQEQSRAVLFLQEQQGGVGGQPFLGRLAAESALMSDSHFVQSDNFSLRDRIRDILRAQDFTKGILLTCNSLTGGTGTGFSPVVTNFMREKVGFSSDLTLNISILPSERETKEQNYPKSILASLYNLLTSQTETGGIVDSVIIIDNDALARYSPPDKRKGFDVYNQMVRDMIAPLVLAPIGMYNDTSLTSSLDTADIRRWIRGGAGFDKPELATVGYATLPTKAFTNGIVSKFSGQKRSPTKVREGMESLADKALSQFMLGCEGEDPRPNVGGVGILFGPPDFFDMVDITDIDYLMDYLQQKLKLPRFRKPDCLKFPVSSANKIDYVGLTILVSGITSSPRLERICENALEGEWTNTYAQYKTIADRIRDIDESVIEDMMIGEIRDALDIGR
jgi:cell division GTPase FtsZ